MHRMNANRSSDGTSVALSDQSVKNIQSGLDKAKERRISSRQQKKTAQKAKTPSEPIKKLAKRIIIANLNEIPADFERMGTGFFRCGHHLWELNSADGGFVLVRKSGEDHVLGYDPEPIVKSASIVNDRFGNTLKVGSRVKLPHRGKVAEATILLLEPQSLGLQTDSGEQISAAPDMVQMIEELLLPLLAETPLPTSEERDESKDKPDAEKEDNDSDKEDETEECHEEEDNEKETESSNSEGLEPSVEPSSKEASLFDALDKAASNIDSWEDYWRNVGRRVAQAAPKAPAKPKTPKIPGQMTPEQKEKRRQTRKERRMMMKGLPPGTKAPPRPKAAASDDDDRAKDKEYVRICQQLVDELKYILQDEEMRNQPEMLLDRVEQAMESFDEEMEDTNEDNKDEMEDKLSIETPPKSDNSLDDLRSANKVVVSMTDLG